jgi:hypothetical protein
MNGDRELTALLERVSSDARLVTLEGFASASERDEYFSQYVQQARDLARERVPTVEAVAAAIGDLPRMSRGDAELAAYLSGVLQGVGAVVPALHAITHATFVEMHMQAAGALRNRSRQVRNRQPLIERAQTLLERALKVVEKDGDDQFAPDLIGNLFFLAGIIHIELGSRTAEEMARDIPAEVLGRDLGPGLYPRLGNESATTGLQYLMLALDTKVRHGIVRDVDQITNGLRAYAKSMIPVRKLGFPPGKAIPMLRTAAQALRAVGDLESFALATLELANAYSSVSQPAEGQKVLEDLLAVDRLPAAIRRDARGALASALTEQGKFAEAADIQRDLLDQV